MTSWHPLVVYLYDEGLARFATEPYSLEHIERRCMHLTNYSLNKHNKRFVPNTDVTQAPAPRPPRTRTRHALGVPALHAAIARARLRRPRTAARRPPDCLPASWRAASPQDDAGSKWSLSAFRRHVIEDFGEARAAEVRAPLLAPPPHAPSSSQARARPWPGGGGVGPPRTAQGVGPRCGRRCGQIWRTVDDIVVKTAISVEHHMSAALPNFVAAAAHGKHNTQCFQVFGFDVMLDGNGRPWLLEVRLACPPPRAAARC